MNAAEQARSLDLTSKIASAVNLFKAQFPDARADLKPWRNDPDTLELVDPDSIDIGFHLPGWSPRFQGRSLLVQIRFYRDPVEQRLRLIGLETAAFNHEGEAWRLSTIDRWQIEGNYQPATDVAERLQEFCRQVFKLFEQADAEPT
ncbi:MAG: hypothetical protein HC838_16325 [Spirulinaceae cyanobacterium RM2_2_10]|nr:hypothetical protein [Spirulinaceae cyanobacterium SM2_1_0]NJO21289.1 hypothetical protein [Spirulinaceae cyanobacterium RM2_2_10]